MDTIRDDVQLMTQAWPSMLDSCLKARKRGIHGVHVLAERGSQIIVGYAPLTRVPHPEIAHMAAQCRPGDPSFMTVVIDQTDEVAAYWVSCLISLNVARFAILDGIRLPMTPEPPRFDPDADPFDTFAEL